MGRISWLFARYKHSNLMGGTTWLFCIKKWSLITTVIKWVSFWLFARYKHSNLNGWHNVVVLHHNSVSFEGDYKRGNYIRGRGAALINGISRYSNTNSMGAQRCNVFHKYWVQKPTAIKIKHLVCPSNDRECVNVAQLNRDAGHKGTSGLKRRLIGYKQEVKTRTHAFWS